MENGIEIFNNTDLGNIRVVVSDDGEPNFCLSDVCGILGLTAKGVGQRLSDEVISNYPIVDKLGRQQVANFINEDGLYDVILDSRKPEAKKFRKWITGEVLPSIRKHGAYMSNEVIEKTLLSPDYLIKLATEIKEERRQKEIAIKEKEKLKIQIKEDEPDTILGKSVSQYDDNTNLNELARILNQNNINIGGNRLKSCLYAMGYLTKDYAPTIRSTSSRILETIKKEWTDYKGNKRISTTAMATPKGVKFFINKFVKMTDEEIRELYENHRR